MELNGLIQAKPWITSTSEEDDGVKMISLLINWIKILMLMGRVFMFQLCPRCTKALVLAVGAHVYESALNHIPLPPTDGTIDEA